MIQTETTPNPDSLKFLSEKTLSTIGTEEFKKEKESEINELRRHIEEKLYDEKQEKQDKEQEHEQETEMKKQKNLSIRN